MLHVVESPSAADRLRAAISFVGSFPAPTEVLIVGASRGAADDLVREVTLATGASFGLHRFSMIQLAARLAAPEMARRGLAPSSGLGAEAIAARVSFEALAEATLVHVAPVVRFPRFARALTGTLEELRVAGVSPAAMNVGGEQAHDVAELLRRFEDELARGSLSDSAALLDIAARAVRERAAGFPTGIPLLLLDVPIDSGARQAFVAALVTASPSVLATVPAGDEATLRALTELNGARQAAASGAPLSELRSVRAYLFSEDSPATARTRDEVILFSAPGEGREAVEIARRILAEARVGTPFDRMAVLLRGPELYSSLLEAALARAEIPVFFARGTKRPDPAGRAFLALLDCAAEGLSARRFAEYLSLAQVPSLDPVGAPPADRAAWTPPEDDALGPAAETVLPVNAPATEQPSPDSDEIPVLEGSLRAPWRWEALLVESAVIGGHDRWRRRLDGLEAEYAVRLEALRADDSDSPRVRALERELADLAHLRRFALPVVERLAELPRSARWGDWIAALEQLAPMTLRWPERVLAVLAELRPLTPIGPVSLDEVRDVLAQQLSSLQERPPAHRYGRVFVGTVEQARGRAFEVVFVPGLAERVFPQKPREDPLLLDTLRERLAARLPTQNERGQRERLLLRLAAGAARRRLYLSYPRLEITEGRPRVASFYALEVERAIAGRIPEPERMAREAAAAAQARLAWPAPEDATQAIDEIEHDLATLWPLLQTPSVTARGAARYLLGLNACLARSLRARYSRWSSPRWSPADGLVRSRDEIRDALQRSRLASRAYSVSALQKFAVCPYQFFLSAILRLEPRTEIARLERLDPLTRGQIFHRVQAEVMRSLQAAGLIPLTRDRLDAAMTALDETVIRLEAEYREELAPAILRVWTTEIEAMRVDLRMWLERSIETQATWEPIAFELSFGLPLDSEVDPQSVTAEAVLPGGFRLRGIVDVVERRRGASDLRVTDHKTGRNDTRPGLVVGGGEKLQPVLYAFAVEQALGGSVTEARLAFCTRVGGFSDRVVRLSDATRQRGLEVLEAIDRAVERGFLPPAPRHGACTYCDFRDVCGPHEEVRSARKELHVLGYLKELRDHP